MGPQDTSTLLDTIARLAEEIARASPECADKARQIGALAAEIGAADIDGATIRDTIETETVGSDLTDAQIGRTADAVVKAVREPS